MRTLKRVLYIAFWIVLLLLLPASFSTWLRDRIAHAVSPLGGPLIRQNRSLTDAIAGIRQIPELRSERANLQQQIITLQQEVARDASLRQENETLRKELGVAGVSRDYPKVLARVILQGSDPLDRTLIVDVGSKQGISVGQPAVYQGALIGRVWQTQDNTATVRLITSSKSIVQAWISDSREKGLLVGDGNNVSLTDITQGIQVAPRSVVETSGLGGSLPQGIQIGQIGDLLSKPSDLSQKFRVFLPTDPSGLESFFILSVTAKP